MAEIFRDRRGATAMEYALILALVALAIIGSVGSVGGATGNLWRDVADKVERA